LKNAKKARTSAFKIRLNELESYKTPNRKKLSGQLLDDVYESIQESVLPVLAAAVKYGSTVASDGWSDVNRRPILNFMNVTRGRTVFLKSIDFTDHMAEGGRKGAAYIASQTISTIEEFSPKNGVQVIMDGVD
jgi:hypothetical protein